MRKTVVRSVGGNLLLRMAFVSVILILVSAGGVGAVTGVNSCSTLSTPGVYVLNQDLTSSNTCITIESSGVIFDGAGYSITGSGSSNYGIYVYKSGTTLTNVTVRNVVVTGWSYGILYYYAENGNIRDTNASNNNDVGIYLGYSIYNNLTNNTASNNNYGIYLYSSSSNNITGNTATNNNLEGIGLYLSGSNNINGNTVSGNSKIRSISYGGIALLESTGNTITGNGVSGEECDGIALWDSSDSNTITSNRRHLSL